MLEYHRVSAEGVHQADPVGEDQVVLLDALVVGVGQLFEFDEERASLVAERLVALLLHLDHGRFREARPHLHLQLLFNYFNRLGIVP